MSFTYNEHWRLRYNSLVTQSIVPKLMNYALRVIYDFQVEEYSSKEFNEYVCDFFLEDFLEEVPDEIYAELPQIVYPWFVFSRHIPATFLDEVFPDLNLKIEDQDDRHYSVVDLMIMFPAFFKDLVNMFNKFEIAYIEATLESYPSFWSVVATYPQHGLTLKDIITNKTINVAEKNATTLKVGSIIYASVVELPGGLNLLECMGSAAMPPEAIELILEEKKELEKDFEIEKDQWETFLKDSEYCTRFIYLAFLRDALGLMGQPIVNTDGDLMDPQTFAFKIKEPQLVIERLSFLAEPLINKSDLLKNTKHDSSGVFAGLEIPWAKEFNNKNQNWNNTVFGLLRVYPDTLECHVNSVERKDRLLDILNDVLGDLLIGESVSLGVDSSDDRAEIFHDKSDDPERDKRELLKIMSEDMIKKELNWFEDPNIPILLGKSARQHLKSKAGQKIVFDVLADFDKRQKIFNQRKKLNDSVSTSMDVARMRELARSILKELAVENYYGI